MRILRPFIQNTTTFLIQPWELCVFNEGRKTSIIQRIAGPPNPSTKNPVGRGSPIYSAVAGERIDIFRHLFEQMYPFPQTPANTCDAFASWSRLATKIEKDGILEECVIIAARVGSVKMLILLHKINPYNFIHHALSTAASRGNVRALYVLLSWHKERYGGNHDTCGQYDCSLYDLEDHAAQNEKLQAIKLLTYSGLVSESSSVVCNLLRDKHKKYFTPKRLRQIRNIANNVNSNAYCSEIISFGDLHIVQRFRSIIMGEIHSAIYDAAACGEITLLRTLLNWHLQQSSNTRDDIDGAIIAASSNGKIKTAQMLRREFGRFLE